MRGFPGCQVWGGTLWLIIKYKVVMFFPIFCIPSFLASALKSCPTKISSASQASSSTSPLLSLPAQHSGYLDMIWVFSVVYDSRKSLHLIFRSSLKTLSLTSSQR